MRRSTLSIMYLVAMLCLGLAVPLALADDGPQASATVSFGQWQTGPADGPPPVLELDRFLPPNQSPRTRNNHQLIPNEVTIKAGGSVNFISNCSTRLEQGTDRRKGLLDGLICG